MNLAIHAAIRRQAMAEILRRTFQGALVSKEPKFLKPQVLGFNGRIQNSGVAERSHQEEE